MLFPKIKQSLNTSCFLDFMFYAIKVLSKQNVNVSFQLFII